MPSEEELRAYANTLPDIYREILAAFPRIVPNRKAGFSLAYQTLAADFEGRGLSFSIGEIIKACERMEQRGLVEIKHGIFLHPTAYGERLVAVLTDLGLAPEEEVPELPAPPV